MKAIDINNKIDNLISLEIQEHIKITSELDKYTHSINLIVEEILKCFKNKGKVMVCGNGGSAADAQHFSSEIVGRYESDRKGFPAISLSTDSSALTAISNDYGFHEVFSRQIESLGQEKDILVVFSSSGNSENIINAIKMAKQLGIFTFGFLGKDGGESSKILNAKITIRSRRTCRVQEMHSLLIHIICQILENKLPEFS